MRAAARILVVAGAVAGLSLGGAKLAWAGLIGEVQVPAYNSTHAQPVTVIGYAFNPDHPTQTGVSAAEVFGCLEAACTWQSWGMATYGVSRPDVAAHYGDARFTNSGFTFVVTGKPAGTYLLWVWVYDTVIGAWLPLATKVTVLPPAGPPVLVVETPTVGQGVSQPLAVAGYALHPGASSGTGVDAVSTWGYPHPGSGQAPVGGALATYGGQRSDVAAAYGAQYLPSGLATTVTGLVAGPHWFAVSSHSVLTGAWQTVARVIYVDSPTNPLTIDRGGTGTGGITATGLSCPGGAATQAVPCGASYPLGTHVTLTAVPDPGVTFDGWLGACTGTSPCTVTLNGAQHVSAVFSTIPGSIATRYYHTDAIGSVRAITDETGAVVIRHDYRPFGEDTQPLTGDPMRFAGKELDPETALHYFDARYYRQTWGRFTTVDPTNVEAALADPQQWNRYAYARNNPLRYGDPNGEFVVEFIMALSFGGGASGGATAASIVAAGIAGFWGELKSLFTTGNSSSSSSVGVKNRRNTQQSTTTTSGSDDNKQPEPFVDGPPNTDHQRRIVRSAIDDAKNTLLFEKCGKFFKGIGISTINSSRYYLVDKINRPRLGASTHGPGVVHINLTGPFFTLPAFLFPPNKPYDKFLTPSAYRKVVILHELGHQIDIFDGDEDQTRNDFYTNKVIEHCIQ